MAAPNKIKEKIGDMTPYQWLNEQLMEWRAVSTVAEKNGITKQALYEFIRNEGLEVVQRVARKTDKGKS